ncbi:hypothetical protein JB92DRAFT_3126361 [Gautieria morchelliformis]|nr:hypothetical protein JB92DRAFT_3126361 [Gautieria morchelliformis]
MPSEGKRRKGPALMYRQRQLARAAALSKCVAINQDIDAVLSIVDNEVKRLNKKYHRSVSWFQHQFFQGGRVVRQKRAVSVYNAAKQVEAFLAGHKGDITDDERMHFEEIQAELHQLGGCEFASKLSHGMQVFLWKQAGIWREKKHSAPQASTRAVVQDARLTLERLSDELMALNARTNMEKFMLRYLLNGMKRHTADIIKDFEAYVLGDVEGLVLNHNGRLAECKSHIRCLICEGLVAITGDPKAVMHYERYEKIMVVDKGVELINWPDGVRFGSVSDIGSFRDLRRLQTALTLEDPEQRCRWVTLSKDNWDARRAAFEKAEAKATPKHRKRQAYRTAESGADSSLESNANGDSNKRRRIGEEADKENGSGGASTSTSKKGKAKQQNSVATGKKRPSTKAGPKKKDTNKQPEASLPARTDDKSPQGMFLLPLPFGILFGTRPVISYFQL